MSTVLLPGTLCDDRVFAAMLPELIDPRVLDHRPFDRADRAAAALIDRVPPGSLGIAFSLGGWVLLEMLALDAGRFRGAVLLAGNAFPDDGGNAPARRAAVADARSGGLDALARGSWAAAAGAGARADEALADVVAAMAEACGDEVHARQAEMNIHRPDRRALAADPPVPILVIAGADDPLCPVERYRQAAAAPGSRLALLAGVGHYVPLEAPRAALAAIGDQFAEAQR